MVGHIWALVAVVTASPSPQSDDILTSRASFADVAPGNGSNGSATDANAIPTCPLDCSGQGKCVWPLDKQVHKRSLSMMQSLQKPSPSPKPERPEFTGVCVCNPGYRGRSCSIVVQTCPNNCTARGECVNGNCICRAGYAGDDCGMYDALRCRNDCSGNGLCISGACRCNPGFAGLDCSVVFDLCPRNCSGHGICKAQPPKTWEVVLPEEGLLRPKEDGPKKEPAQSASNATQEKKNVFSCVCEPGHSGLDCSEVNATCPNNCTGHGACHRGKCRCEMGYGGEACSLVVEACPRNCSGHGKCVDGVCLCRLGFAGLSCSHVLANVCPLSCSGHGICDERTGRCKCAIGYTGDGCSKVAGVCLRNCTGHGRCIKGACVCSAGWSGKDCSKMCPNKCSGHGDCRDGKCTCETGWSGEDCSFDEVNSDFSPSGGITYSGAIKFVLYFLGALVVGGILYGLVHLGRAVIWGSDYFTKDDGFSKLPGNIGY